MRILFVLALMCQAAQGQLVRIETDLGAIDVRLDAVHAPRTTANFLRYVDAGAYDGGRFHRTVRLDNQPQNNVKIEVIQAGPEQGKGHKDLPPIQLERTSSTGINHLNGVISMARSGPDTATSDFFICIGDQPSLNFGGARNADGQGFAAFGKVAAGMDVVKKIQLSPSEDQKLTPPVKILRVRKLE